MKRLMLVLALVGSTAFADEPPASTSLDPTFRGSGSITDGTPQRRSRMASVFVGIPAWYFGWGGFPFSVGGRFYQPILHDGFIPRTNDSFGIEVGADFIGVGSTYFGGLIGIPVEALWAFHFSPRLAAYVKAGIAFEVRFGNWTWNGNGDRWTGFTVGPVADLGVWFKITDVLTLRLEVGYPGLKLGLGFDV